MRRNASVHIEGERLPALGLRVGTVEEDPLLTIDVLSAETHSVQEGKVLGLSESRVDEATESFSKGARRIDKRQKARCACGIFGGLEGIDIQVVARLQLETEFRRSPAHTIFASGVRGI